MPLTYSFIFPTHKLELLEIEDITYPLFYLSDTGEIASINSQEISLSSKNIVDVSNMIITLLSKHISNINIELVKTFLINIDKDKIKKSIDPSDNYRSSIGFIITKECIYYLALNEQELDVEEFIKSNVNNKDECDNLEEITIRESQRLGIKIYSCKLVFKDTIQTIALQNKTSTNTIKYKRSDAESVIFPSMTMDNTIVTTRNITKEDNVELTVTTKHLNESEAHLKKRQSFIDDFHRDGLIIENEQNSVFIQTPDSGTYATHSSIKKHIIDKIIEINPTASMKLLELFFIGPSPQEYPILLAPPSIFNCVGARLLRFKFSNDHITFSWVFIGIHQKFLIQDNELSKPLSKLTSIIDHENHDLSPQYTANILHYLFENAAKNQETSPYLDKLTGIQTTAKIYYHDGELIVKDSFTRIVFGDGIRSDEKDELLFSDYENQFPMNYTISISRNEIKKLNEPTAIEDENQMRSYLNGAITTPPYIENAIILRDHEGFDDEVVTSFVPHKNSKYMLKLGNVTKHDIQEILKLITNTSEIDLLFSDPITYIDQRRTMFKMCDGLNHSFMAQVFGKEEESPVKTIKTIDVPYYETKEYQIYVSTLSMWSTQFSDCLKIASENPGIIKKLTTRIRAEDCTKYENERYIWDFDALGNILDSCEIEDFFYITHVSYDGQTTLETTPVEKSKQELFKSTSPIFQDFLKQVTDTVIGEIPQENQLVNFFSNLGTAIGQKFIEKAHKLNASFFKVQYNNNVIIGNLAIPEDSKDIEKAETIKKLFNKIPESRMNEVNKCSRVTSVQNELLGNPAILKFVTS